MGFQNIEKKSTRYALLKVWAQWWHNKIFYKKIIKVNSENIPAKDNVIFTPNHQNALMDALGPLFTINQQLVFLARADIFSKKSLASFLYFLKILPIFRIRDGYQSLKKNDAIFQKTIDVINAGNGLVILPEGTHAGIHRLRQLKKGFARIAFKTEEENNFSMNIQIVPIGLYYSDYESFRSVLLLNFGKPIAVSKYYDVYKNNPAVAIAKLKDELHDALRLLIIDIESEEYYFVYDKLRQYRAAQVAMEKKPEIRQFQAQQEIISKLEKIEKKNPEKMESLNLLVHNFDNLLGDSKLNFETIEKGNPKFYQLFFKTLLLNIGFPFFIYGYLNNLLPWQITVSLAGKIKDPQFRSSVKYLFSILLFPIFYLIQSALFYYFISEKWMTIAYFLSLPLMASISWMYFSFFKKVKNHWRLFWLKIAKPIDYNRLNETYKNISDELKFILTK